MIHDQFIYYTYKNTHLGLAKDKDKQTIVNVYWLCTRGGVVKNLVQILNMCGTISELKVPWHISIYSPQLITSYLILIDGFYIKENRQ